MKHLSEEDISKLVIQEPTITIREYLDLLNEIAEIGKSQMN
jgi:hypothetical protein